ncbi:type IA DNA topoisomerase [Xanthovirga aplysinae]|uniref:type IA DNA topoisomerase n=1 Tax=Xanthovirga aplysinae TaxID=2529853 RepID=UPI0012BD4847|nr:type IA DNA topoisomerase [Xanthovirga aplysinae]MTI33541.1 type IA DNA topoisomerase [Xanthovirga aplysinae]
MKVCIAEKPSVAREIASVIGANSRHEGYFEGNGYQVTWTFGHLCTLKEPDDYSMDLKRWSLNFLPIIPPKFGIKVIKDKGVEKQFGIIEKLVLGAQEVINCGDAGQEGELIQRWVLTKAKCNKPIKRLWISSLTEEAIRQGFQELKENHQFDSLYAAGSSRAIGDWLLGINATRLYTLKYGSGKQVLSIGRVQTPTLSLIVNRHLEIVNFKPQTYWELKTNYRDVVFSCEKGKYPEKEKAEEVLQSIKDKPFTIISFSKKKGKEAPPRLFDLTSLQVECNKKFGFSADQTLKTVQSLYEKKFVTYPRVDTTYLSNDIYPKVGGIMKALKDYTEFTQTLMGKPFRKSKKVFDDKKITDHHAIIPTNITATHLTGYERQVFDVIARRFIAAFYEDCIISKTQVIGEVNEVKFKASGKQILEEGWRVLYSKGDKQVMDEEGGNEKEGNQILPEFKEGESGPHEPSLAEKQTKPPKPYTEATLLRAMETAGKHVENESLREAMKENGIGRPSTRANIIETLFRRKYIQKNRKSIEATITGIQLIATIKNELLKSAELTGQWEYKLRLIEKGEYEVQAFMDEMKQMVSEVVLQVKNDFSTRSIALVEEKKEEKRKTNARKEAKVSFNEIICPKCKKGKILKGNAAYGCSEWKNGCSLKVDFEIMGKKLTEKQLLMLLAKGKTKLIKSFLVEGVKKDGVLYLDQDHKVLFEENKVKQTPKVCPKCKTGNIIKGKTAWGCANWKNGCKFILPFEFRNKKFTESQCKALLAKGRTGVVKGVQFENGGEKVNGRFLLDKDFKLQFVTE